MPIPPRDRRPCQRQRHGGVGASPPAASGGGRGDPPRQGECDPYRFLELPIAGLLRGTTAHVDAASEIPWAEVTRPLSESRVSQMHSSILARLKYEQLVTRQYTPLALSEIYQGRTYNSDGGVNMQSSLTKLRRSSIIYC